MLEKRKAWQNVRRVHQLATDTAHLTMPMPTYIEEVRLELLFFYFFLLDYRRFHKERKSVRECTFAAFLVSVAEEFEVEDPRRTPYRIYEPRIDFFHRSLQRAERVRDFLERSSGFIAALALYSQKLNKIATVTASDPSKLHAHVEAEMVNKLREPISMSIQMNAVGLL